ncbi:MAG: sigma-70 family RNA polymerase sigma factor [Crocinitomicaceae bacterium]|nr:sigma-70 family RNA polymerase sigma factor [Crocinitomicaceae bacterium]
MEELVNQLQGGSEIALSKLYDIYSSSLYGLVLKIVRDDELAQDILQDCFVKIWKKAQTYSSSKGTFFTWMLNICRNKSIDELRKNEREREGKDKLANSESYSVLGTETNINVIGLKGHISKLSKEQQIIIEYIYFKGYTQQEVSDELGIPLGTVKTRARLAVIELREIFVTILLFWIAKNT